MSSSLASSFFMFQIQVLVENLTHIIMNLLPFVLLFCLLSWKVLCDHLKRKKKNKRGKLKARGIEKKRKNMSWKSPQSVWEQYSRVFQTPITKTSLSYSSEVISTLRITFSCFIFLFQTTCLFCSLSLSLAHIHCLHAIREDTSKSSFLFP